MKRILLIAAAGLFAGLLAADSVVVTVPFAGAAAKSVPIRASGYLDRVEFYRADPGSDVVGVTLATYQGNTALNTFATVSAMATNAATVIRPRVIGTTTAGVNLTHAAAGFGTGTNVTQFLTVPYEKMLLGGNMELRVTASAGTNGTVKAVLYFQREPR